MAGLPIADSSQILDTLFLSTANTLTTDPAWLVNDRGEKMVRKAAERGRVFKEISDADDVEHLLTTGTTGSNWKYYSGSRSTVAGMPAMGSNSELTTAQNGIWAMARSTILDVASNFVIPEDLAQRPVQKQIDTMTALLERHLNEFYREQEAYLVLGASADGGDPDALAPYKGDMDFAGTGTAYSIPSFSLLGLLSSGTDMTGAQYGDLGAQSFMDVAGDDAAEWVPYQDAVDDGAKVSLATNGQTVYEYIQKFIIALARYGPGEQVTDWMCTTTMYEEILKYMRGKANINDTLLANLATTTEIPISGTMLDFHHFLAANANWDIGSTTSAEAVHPLIGINWNSLRFNMVYGEANEGSWLTPISDFQVSEDSTWMYKRLHSRSCWSLDGGRRSFVLCDRFKDA